MNTVRIYGFAFLGLALVMLLLSMLFGSLAAHSYTAPGFWKDWLGFIQLRPLHVSAALFWIFLGATGGLLLATTAIPGLSFPVAAVRLQLILWVIAIVGIFYSYFNGQFGGREYLEFPPVYAIPIAISWAIFAFNIIRAALRITEWPVYIWMWITGLIFFLFTFGEAYLWEFSWFRAQVVKDTAIQWKSTGAMVGSWNQLIYGLGFYLMERIGGDKSFTRSRIAFGMYFLGMFNLLFNWSHHIYTLPTAQYVRYVGYTVSMTEWILFIRIIYTWKRTVSDAEKHLHHMPIRFLLAADVWVFLNLGLALLMSIPAINIYTHGTHITVAHAMGTTIGINTMILIAACLEFIQRPFTATQYRWFMISYWVAQVSLLMFWITLIIAGIIRSTWQMSAQQVHFQELNNQLNGWFRLFNYEGTLLLLSLGTIAIFLIRGAWMRIKS